MCVNASDVMLGVKALYIRQPMSFNNVSFGSRRILQCFGWLDGRKGIQPVKK